MLKVLEVKGATISVAEKQLEQSGKTEFERLLEESYVSKFEQGDIVKGLSSESSGMEFSSMSAESPRDSSQLRKFPTYRLTASKMQLKSEINLNSTF